MLHFPRRLSLSTALACFAVLSSAQSGPQLAVSPGTLSTAASGTNNILAGNPDNTGITILPRFEGVAFRRNSSNQPQLLVSDGAKYSVYLVDLTSGQVSVFAGNGTRGSGGDGGAATSAQFGDPTGLALDSAGNLFIADTLASNVRRVDATSGVITTFLNSGQVAFPVGLAFDSVNNKLIVADAGNNRVLSADPGSSSATIIAGTGSGTAALNKPVGVAASNGSIYITDNQNNLVRKLSGGTLSNLSSAFTAPFGVAADAGGNVYVSDSTNARIAKIANDGSLTVSTIAGTGTAGLQGDGGSALQAQVGNALELMSFDSTSGTLYFADSQAVRSLSFAPRDFKVSSGSVLTLSNNGGSDLHISAVTPPSGFSITGGSCGSPSITVQAGKSCTLFVTGSGSGNMLISSDSVSNATYNLLLFQPNGLRFVPVTPCRVIDTRLPDPTFGGGAFTATQSRTYDIRNSSTIGCGTSGQPANPIPTGANVQAYAVNVTVVPIGPLPYVTLYPDGSQPPPVVSTLNSYDGRVKANAAIVPLRSSDKTFSIYARQATDIIVDVAGYFVPDSSALAYYPVPPCRAVDTRRTGSTAISPNTAQTISLPGSGCGVPANAAAFSVNVTAIPRAGSLNYMTLRPAGAASYVSTLNSRTGAVVANAAIVPPDGSGNIEAFSTDLIDLIVDVNGYFAPANAAGLSYYAITPCRAYDSRGYSDPLVGAPLPTGANSQDTLARCGPSLDDRMRSAQSLVLNTTVLPTASLIYLANWATGTSQPLLSTLNSYDASVVSNLAIVPTLNGSVSSYLTAPSGLILDLSGYFAP